MYTIPSYGECCKKMNNIHTLRCKIYGPVEYIIYNIIIKIRPESGGGGCVLIRGCALFWSHTVHHYIIISLHFSEQVIKIADNDEIVV